MRKRLIASGSCLLKGARQAQWRRLWTAHDFPASEKIVDGAYLLIDSGSGEGFAICIRNCAGDAPRLGRGGQQVQDKHN